MSRCLLVSLCILCIVGLPLPLYPFPPSSNPPPPNVTPLAHPSYETHNGCLRKARTTQLIDKRNLSFQSRNQRYCIGEIIHLVFFLSDCITWLWRHNERRVTPKLSAVTEQNLIYWNPKTAVSVDTSVIFNKFPDELSFSYSTSSLNCIYIIIFQISKFIITATFLHKQCLKWYITRNTKFIMVYLLPACIQPIV